MQVGVPLYSCGVGWYEDSVGVQRDDGQGRGGRLDPLPYYETPQGVRGENRTASLRGGGPLFPLSVSRGRDGWNEGTDRVGGTADLHPFLPSDRLGRVPPWSRGIKSYTPGTREQK